MSVIKKLLCKHEYEFERNIYGDMISMTGGMRSLWRCRKCGKGQFRADLYESLEGEDDDCAMTETGEISDGYHTFNELYHHRAVLFSVIVRDHFESAWKSKLHHDGTMYDGMFIVGIETPNGQATYHYDVDPYWEMFDCRELERAPEWDGHTPDQAIERIATLEYAGMLPFDRLLTALERDWGLDVTYDTVRCFWNVGLTEEHRLEVKRLREYLTMAGEVIDHAVVMGYNARPDELKRMHETLRELGASARIGVQRSVQTSSDGTQGSQPITPQLG